MTQPFSMIHQLNNGVFDASEIIGTFSRLKLKWKTADIFFFFKTHLIPIFATFYALFNKVEVYAVLWL